MDIKINTAGGWPIESKQRARKTTLGECFTTKKAYARVIVEGPAEARLHLHPGSVPGRSQVGGTGLGTP